MIRKLLLYIIKKFPLDYNTFRKIVLEFEKRNDYFISLSNRPKKSDLIKTETISYSTSLPPIAIVIQGPIVYEEDFTLETIKIYKKHYPNVKIILSTWETENKEYLMLIEKLDVTVIANKFPEDPGFQNLNLQTTSTINGLRKAKEDGAEYVIKSRTDNRFYAPDVLEFLYTIIEKYSIDMELTPRNRLVAISYISKKFIPYFVPDLFMFGHIDDMILYWGLAPDNRKISNEDIKKETIESIIKKSNSVHYAKQYLTKVGFRTELSLTQSNKAWKDYFCVIDKEMIDFYWYQKSPSIDKHGRAYSYKDPKRYLDRTYIRLQETREKVYDDRHFMQPMRYIDWYTLINSEKTNDIFDLNKISKFNRSRHFKIR